MGVSLYEENEAQAGFSFAASEVRVRVKKFAILPVTSPVAIGPLKGIDRPMHYWQCLDCSALFLIGGFERHRERQQATGRLSCWRNIVFCLFRIVGERASGT